MVVRKQRSARTAPRQRLHSTFSMLKCDLHLEGSLMAKLQLVRGLVPLLRGTTDWRNVEWSLASPVQHVGLSGLSGICMGRAPRHAWRQTSQQEDVKHQTRRRPGCGSCTERGNECGSTERTGRSTARNLTHLPAAAWCEVCDWHARVKYDSEIPCVQIDF